MILYYDNHYLYDKVLKCLIFLINLTIIDRIYIISFLNINIHFSLIFPMFSRYCFVQEISVILSNVVILSVAEVEPKILKSLIFPTVFVGYVFILDFPTRCGTITKVRKSLQIRTVKASKIKVYQIFLFLCYKIRTYTWQNTNYIL